MRRLLFILLVLLTFSASAVTRRAVPGYLPAALGHGADIVQSSAWRGRWADITGFYNIGLRPYDPISGRWLTYDSVWNERDPNYYTFAGGEPINSFDSDGRLSTLSSLGNDNGIQNPYVSDGSATGTQNGQSWLNNYLNNGAATLSGLEEDDSDC